MPTPEPSRQPVYDVLGSPEPAPRRPGRSGLAAALVGAAAMAVAGSAVAFATFLGGGGAQPEDVLPSNVMAMVKLDLDPAAGQKVAVYRLAQRFPSVADKVRDQDQVKDQLLSALFEDAEEVDYETDIQPWIGDRVAVALLPGGEEPQPLAAVAFTDRAEAEKSLAGLRDRALEDTSEEGFYAFSEQADYVLIGTSQAQVDDAARGEEVLAGSASWEEGIEALDGDQIVTMWADVGAVWSSLPTEAREDASDLYGLEADFAMAGTVVAGLRAAENHVEVIGKALDVESPLQPESALGAGASSGMVQGLPADTLAALSVTNLGPTLAELFSVAYPDQDPLGVVASAQDMGITLPDDVASMLGNETLLGVFGEQDLALRTRTDDVDTAYGTAEKLAALIGGGADTSRALRRLDDGIAFGSTPEALDAVATDDGGLGSTDGFRAAVPDADGAGYVVYVDLAHVLEQFGDVLGAGEQDAAQLKSLGISGSGDSRNGSFRLRLTVKD